MISLLSIILIICGVGLLSSGSGWCIPFILAAGGCSWLADRMYDDIAVLGGLCILFVIGVNLWAGGLWLANVLFGAH